MKTCPHCNATTDTTGTSCPACYRLLEEPAATAAAAPTAPNIRTIATIEGVKITGIDIPFKDLFWLCLKVVAVVFPIYLFALMAWNVLGLFFLSRALPH